MFASSFSKSTFDGRKLLVIMIILAVTLTIESQIGVIADFIPEELTSIQGIAGFIGIWAIFTVTQYYLLVYLNIIIKTAELELGSLIWYIVLCLLRSSYWQESLLLLFYRYLYLKSIILSRCTLHYLSAMEFGL